MVEEDDAKPISSPGILTQNLAFEQIYNEVNGNHYLVWDRIEQKFRSQIDVWHNYTHEGIQYFPLQRLPWPSVSGIGKYENEEALYHEIYEFMTAHLDVANPLLYDVYTCFVLASWRTEDFKVLPYLLFLGPLSSGKTRGLECFQRLCYRAIIAASMTAASLFRILEVWHPTLLLDETEIYNKENMAEVTALLNSGYRRGQYAIRMEKVESGNPKVGMYDTFGFKVLAGTEELAATLQSRCIITAMSRAVRQVNLFIDEEKAQQLRNKLLCYRFRNLGKIDNNLIAVFLRENEGFRNARVIELFISLIQVAPTQQAKSNLLELMKQITQSRLDEEQASIEARILDAIVKSKEDVENGKIDTQAITEVFNNDLKEKDQATSRFIGRKVAALGFEKCRVGRKGQAGFYWNEKLISRLKARYFPASAPTLTSVTPETPETSACMDKTLRTKTSCAEVVEVKTGTYQANILTSLPLNTVLSEVSEQTEVNPETAHQPNMPTTEGNSSHAKHSTYFRRLPPNEPHRCDAEGSGGSCAFLAMYQMGDENYYCEKHFLASRRYCEENDYVLIEGYPDEKKEVQPN
jgi:hypothetical protein